MVHACRPSTDADSWLRPRFWAAGAVAHPALHAQSPAESDFVPVTDAMLQAPAPGDWADVAPHPRTAGATAPSTRSNRDNVGDLRLVWSRALRAGGRQQGTPLVYDGVLYMPNPSDVIQAIDAATGDLIWEYQRPLPDDACERIMPGVCTTNRNLAIYDDLIIDTSVDEFVFALDAKTGRARVGDAGARLHDPSGEPEYRADHRQRQGDLGTELHARGRAGRLRHHSARPAHRRGAVAAAHHPAARRAGRRDVGAACPTPSGATSARGWRRATIPL